VVLVLSLLMVCSLAGVGWFALTVAGSCDRYRSRNGADWPFGGFRTLKPWALVAITWSLFVPGVAAFRVALAPGDTLLSITVATLLVGGVFAVLNLFYVWLTRFALPPEGR